MNRLWTLLLVLSAVPAPSAPRACTPEELRAHLGKLKALVAGCAAAKTAVACDPVNVGADDQVALPGGNRVVEFEWLRLALASAPDSKTAGADLEAATKRLDLELSELAAAAPPAKFTAEQATLRTILASGDFPQPPPPSLLERLRDAFFTWLDNALNRLAGRSAGVLWIPQMLMGVLALAACGALIWWFSRTSRKQRLAPGGAATDEQAAAALKDWQVWMEEARQLAAERRWREGIHRLYWAAIAQMESRGAWRPDPARTPREYVALLAPESGARTDLLQLTRSLENFWYGGRAAEEQDYRRAAGFLERLVTP